MHSRLNCWEFKKCGREPEGKNVSLYGVCPVSIASSVDGIHDGKNGGRCCWTFAPENFKHEDPVLTCLEKALKCSKCDFYKLVKDTTVLLSQV